MRKFWTVLTALMFLAAGSLQVLATDVPTHDTIKRISLKTDGGAVLQTIASTPDGKIAALLSSSDHGSPRASKAADEVRILDANGAELSKWTLDFTGQSIGAGPDGSIYVAGDGQLAKYSTSGKLLAKLEVPHIAEVLKDNAKIKEMAEAQLKEQSGAYTAIVKSLTDEIKTLEDKGKEKLKEQSKTSEPIVKSLTQEYKAPETSGKDGLTDEERTELEQMRANLKVYEQYTKGSEKENVEKVMLQVTSRLRYINAISATDKDVFIVCGELKGRGYAVWRMDREFKNPVQVMSGVPGCCGQMDVQAQGESIYVAENCKHRIAQYDRDGKALLAFGKHSREESEGDNFGGCCNPMNCRVCGNGDVYTAESEGVIKKFNAKGQFEGLVATVKLEGGCKNVAVAASPTGDKVYLCDHPGSKVVILGKRSPDAYKAAVEKQAEEDKKVGARKPDEESLFGRIIDSIFR